jgi:L-amino acid N-acyltransferase YncA
LFSIRVLTEEDFKKFRDIRLESLKTDPLSYGVDLSDELGRTDDEWKKICRDSLYVIAEHNGVCIGILGASALFGAHLKHQIEVVFSYINPKFRRQGLTKKLFDFLTTELRKKTYLEQMIVWVNLHEAQTGRFVFEKLGFKFAGILSRALKIKGQYYDCCWLEKRLYD